MKNLADITIDRKTGEVVVMDERGKEVYRAPKTEQYISIAHAIYMSHKYRPREEATA